ncbi:MAG: GTPase, partial [Cyanobium sp. MAG_216]|nr:GTPase [Cyanobium sp. MAG_216]
MPTTLKPWLPAIGTGVMGWFALDGLLRLSHLPIASGLTLAGLGLGALLLRRRQPRGPAPTDVPGWLGRLEQLEAQFLRLAGEPAPAQAELDSQLRKDQLAALRQELERQGLQLALVGTCPPALALQPDLIGALRGPETLQLHWAHPLPAWSADWSWPEVFAACDLLIHHLRTPLSAADLRWLEAL